MRMIWLMTTNLRWLCPTEHMITRREKKWPSCGSDDWVIIQEEGNKYNNERFQAEIEIGGDYSLNDNGC